MGESTAWVPSALIGILTLSVSLQYTMVIGDSFSSIFSAWGLPSLIASRSGAIVFLTALGTLPLSLLPSLSALGFTSLLGVGGLLYTAAFMVANPNPNLKYDRNPNPNPNPNPTLALP